MLGSDDVRNAFELPGKVASGNATLGRFRARLEAEVGDGEMESLLKKEEVLRLVMAEMNYWQKLDNTEDPVLSGIQIGAMGACSNIIAAIATGEWMSTQMAGADDAELETESPNER